jgi:hypothetical protein
MILTSAAFFHTVLPTVVALQAITLAAVIAHHNQKNKQWERHWEDFEYPWADSDSDDDISTAAQVQSDDECLPVPSTGGSPTHRSTSSGDTGGAAPESSLPKKSKNWVKSRTYSVGGVDATLFWAEGDTMPVHVQMR